MSAPGSTRWASPAPAAPAWRWRNGSSRVSRRWTCGPSTSGASQAFTATMPGCAAASPRRSAFTTRCRGRSASRRAAARSAARRSTIASRRAARASATRWAGNGPTGLRAPARRPTCNMAGVAAPPVAGSMPSPPSIERRAKASRSPTRPRSESCWCRGAMPKPCCSGFAPTTSPCRSVARSIPAC